MITMFCNWLSVILLRYFILLHCLLAQEQLLFSYKDTESKELYFLASSGNQKWKLNVNLLSPDMRVGDNCRYVTGIEGRGLA